MVVSVAVLGLADACRCMARQPEAHSHTSCTITCTHVIMWAVTTCHMHGRMQIRTHTLRKAWLVGGSMLNTWCGILGAGLWLGLGG